jgi:hypothetical protein
VECTEVFQKRILDGFRELAFARSYFTITQHSRALDLPQLRSTEGNVGLPFVPLLVTCCRIRCATRAQICLQMTIEKSDILK